MIDLKSDLKSIFGFDEFQPGQEEVIRCVLDGHSAAAIFPTGGGKSLCYQYAAVKLPYLTLVVSPLLALIQDQMAFLKKNHIAAGRIDSTLSPAESSQTMQRLRNNEIKVLMISVERFKNERFRNFLSSIKLSMLVVDEAHCISEWGHNFRPDYMKIPNYKVEYQVPLVMLLTATATPKVVADMSQKFDIQKEHFVITGFYRKNLELHIDSQPKADIGKKLLAILAEAKGQSTIVYVTLQKTAELISNFAKGKGLDICFYHAGLKMEEREVIQNDFMAGRIDTVVATIAFGMGIDKSNVRNVIHYNLPKSIESYCQEIGRAGRDGETSKCILLANRDNQVILENFIYGDTPEKAGIDIVLGEIREAVLEGHDQWEILPTSLATKSNIRALPLKTMLVYLELKGVIKSLYSYFAEYRFKNIKEDSVILSGFTGERQAFLKEILRASRLAKSWRTFEKDLLPLEYREQRSRIVKALDYLHENGMIQLESKRTTEVYQILLDKNELTPEYLEGLSNTLAEDFLVKEKEEIKRIEDVIGFFETGDCINRQLASHFGDDDAPEKCGHCSSCFGKAAKLHLSIKEVSFDQYNFQELTSELVNKATESLSTVTITKFLCGITSPVLSRMRVKKFSGAGIFEEVSFNVVRDWVASST